MCLAASSGGQPSFPRRSARHFTQAARRLCDARGKLGRDAPDGAALLGAKRSASAVRATHRSPRRTAAQCGTAFHHPGQTAFISSPRREASEISLPALARAPSNLLILAGDVSFEKGLGQRGPGEMKSILHPSRLLCVWPTGARLAFHMPLLLETRLRGRADLVRAGRRSGGVCGGVEGRRERERERERERVSPMPPRNAGFYADRREVLLGAASCVVGPLPTPGHRSRRSVLSALWRRLERCPRRTGKREFQRAHVSPELRELISGADLYVDVSPTSKAPPHPGQQREAGTWRAAPA
ncbi:Protein of unknown function [Gryllus bimaculatus]|nr:Protein of unknown function [Gryllus bimaculatus]